jgi:hypothetical protein
MKIVILLHFIFRIDYIPVISDIVCVLVDLKLLKYIEEHILHGTIS